MMVVGNGDEGAEEGLRIGRAEDEDDPSQAESSLKVEKCLRSVAPKRL